MHASGKSKTSWGAWVHQRWPTPIRNSCPQCLTCRSSILAAISGDVQSILQCKMRSKRTDPKPAMVKPASSWKHLRRKMSHAKRLSHTLQPKVEVQLSICPFSSQRWFWAGGRIRRIASRSTTSNARKGHWGQRYMQRPAQQTSLPPISRTITCRPCASPA